MKWKIYYGDNSTYSERDGPPEDAPKRNIIAIAQANEITGHCIERGVDYYCWFGYWRGCDIFGLFDYLSMPGYKIVLFGRWTTHEEYRDIVKRATEDPDLPPRSAWFREERR